MLPLLSGLYAQGVAHGDVTPHSILIDASHPNDPHFKLNSTQNLINNYKRALIEADDGRWHVAPELLPALASRDLRPHYDV